jgi:hypothetical protein
LRCTCTVGRASKDGPRAPWLSSFEARQRVSHLRMTDHAWALILAAAKRPSFAKSLPSKTEGAGKTGCALHPRSRVQCARRNAHTSIQVQRRASGLPCAMALRLIARSPRRRIPLVTVACGLRLVQARLGRRISASLTSATDARTTRLRRTQQPVFAHRLRRALAPFVCAPVDRSRETRPAIAASRRRCRVHRISTRVRDDRDPPLVWVRRAELCL